MTTDTRCAACPARARTTVALALWGGPARQYRLCDRHTTALQSQSAGELIEALELQTTAQECGICGRPAQGLLARPARGLRRRGAPVILASFLCGPCFARRDLDRRLLDATSQRA